MKLLDRPVLIMAVEDIDAVVAIVADEEVVEVILVDEDTTVEVAVEGTHGEAVEVEQMLQTQLRPRRQQHNFVFVKCNFVSCLFFTARGFIMR